MNPKDKAYKYPESTLNTSNATWFVRLDDNKSHKKNKTGPCRRWGHSSEVLENKLIIYGGTGYTTNPRHWESVYALDLENWDWTKLEPANKSPGSRDSHSCVIYQKKLYIFGGSNGTDSRNDMLEYDLATSLWKKLDVRGNVPSPREGHSACLFDDRYIVIYGGWDGEETFNDCYLFDIPQRNWVSITQKIGTEPLPRESQSCCMLRNSMYLFGGQGNNIQKEGENLDNFCNDLHRLQITFEGNQVIATWDKLDIPGPKPSKRSSHASCAYQDKYMFIIGGEGYPPGYDEENKAGEYRKPQLNTGDGEKDYPCYPKNDVWYYELDLNHWFPVKVKNEHEFIARFAHSCHNFKDYIVVFGGLQDYHSSTNDICVLSLDKTNPFNMKPTRGKSNVGSASQFDNESDDSMEKQEQEEIADKAKNTPAQINEPEKIEKPVKVLIEREEKIERQFTLPSLTSQTSAMKQEALETLEEIEKLKNADTYYNEDEKVTEETSLVKSNTRPKRVIPERFKAITPTHHTHHPAHTETVPAAESVRENTVFPIKEAPLVSLSFLNALSGIMSWPLAAFGLLLDNALISQASVMRINYMTRVKRDMTKRKSNMKEMVEESKGDAVEGSNKQVYLQIDDDGAGWKHEDFLRVIMNYDTDKGEELKNGEQSQEKMPEESTQKANKAEEMSKRLNEYSFNLKIAGLRLGKSMIYISRSEDEVSLGFLSADKRFNPNVHKNHVFYYSWKRTTGVFVSSHALKHKNIIWNALKGIITEEEIIKGIDKVSNRIIVLDLNPVFIMKTNGEKGKDYELILKKKDQSESRGDIVVRTLDSDLRDFYTGTSVPLIELSLRTYFRHFFLDTSKIGLQVYLEDAPVEFLDVKGSSNRKAETDRPVWVKEEGLFEGVIVRSDSGQGSDHNKAMIKGAKNDEMNQGVLVYFKNRLIRRLENPKLGNLDFLSSQHKILQDNGHGKEIFDVNGYVELRGYFKPNVFKTEIENPYYSNYLYSKVMPSLYELRHYTGKRKNQVAPDDGDNVVKKVKTVEELK